MVEEIINKKVNSAKQSFISFILIAIAVFSFFLFGVWDSGFTPDFKVPTLFYIMLILTPIIIIAYGYTVSYIDKEYKKGTKILIRVIGFLVCLALVVITENLLTPN